MRSAPLAPSCRVLGLVLTSALFAATCGPMPAIAQGQGVQIATLFAAGPYVSVNDRPAVNGMPINSGDTVVTGADSSANLSFPGGGWVQSDANTVQQVLRFAQQGYGCLARVVLAQGQEYVGGRGVCISHGPTMISPMSEFNLLVAPGGEVLTVTSGEVAVGGAQWTTVAAGTQASIAGGRIVAQRPVSAEELSRITAWRHRYRFAQAAPAPYIPSPYTYTPQPYRYTPGLYPYGPSPGPSVRAPAPSPWVGDGGSPPHTDRRARCPVGARCPPPPTLYTPPPTLYTPPPALYTPPPTQVPIK